MNFKKFFTGDIKGFIESIPSDIKRVTHQWTKGTPLEKINLADTLEPAYFKMIDQLPAMAGYAAAGPAGAVFTQQMGLSNFEAERARRALEEKANAEISRQLGREREYMEAAETAQKQSEARQAAALTYHTPGGGMRAITDTPVEETSPKNFTAKGLTLSQIVNDLGMGEF